DGAMSPPAGAPNDILEFGTNSLNLYRFHVDWANTANTTLTGPTTISVAAFTPACSGGGTCIPQSGTSQQLDSLADRLMYRLELRDAPGHPVHSAHDIRSARRDGPRRRVDHRRRGLTDALPRDSAAEPLGRLLEPQRRPVRRLHILVHERISRLERRVQLAHAHRH